FIREELPRKRLIDDHDVEQRRPVLLGDAPPSQDWSSNDIKVSRRNTIHGGKVVIPGTRWRMSIHQDAPTPISAAQRGILTESHSGNTWNTCQGFLDSPVKQRELVHAIAGRPGIDVGDHSPVLAESEILILQALQRGCQQS